MYKKPSEILRRAGIRESFFLRLFAAYFTVSLIELIISAKRNIDPIAAWQVFSSEFSVITKLIFAALCFLALSALHIYYENADSYLLFISVSAFSVLAVRRSGSFYTAAAISVCAVIFSLYAYSKLTSAPKLPKLLPQILIAFFAISTFIFVIATTFCKQKTFGTPCFDMGIFVQTFHALKETLTAVITCERNVAMSHFRVHGSFIFYLLLPFYSLFPSPETLLVFQAVAMTAAVVPLYLIAKNRGFEPLQILCICMTYIFSLGILMPCYYPFHENSLLPLLLMWLLWSVDRKNPTVFYLMSALVCTVKEDAPLYVICIGFYFLATEKSPERFHGLIASALAGIYFIFIMSYLTKYGDGGYMTSSRLGILIDGETKGFAGIFSTVIKNPARFFSLFITERSFLFILETFLPLMFLPFMSASLSGYFLMIPYVIMCLVIGAGYGYASDIGFQYVTGPICLLIYLSVINAGKIEKGRGKILAAAATVSFICAFAMATPKISYVKDYRENREYYDSADEVLSEIPEDATVLANTFLLPHVAERLEVYELTESLVKTGIDPDDYDYYALSIYDPLTEKLTPILEEEGFEIVAESKDFVQIWGYRG